MKQHSPQKLSKESFVQLNNNDDDVVASKSTAFVASADKMTEDIHEVVNDAKFRNQQKLLQQHGSDYRRLREELLRSRRAVNVMMGTEATKVCN